MSHLPPILNDGETQRVHDLMEARITFLMVALESTREAVAYWDGNTPYLRAVVVGWLESLAIGGAERSTMLRNLIRDLRGGDGHPL